MESKASEGHRSSSFDNQDEEAEDTLAPLCTCGQFASLLDPSKQPKHSRSKKSPSWLESSFVHLMTPRSKTSTKEAHHCHPQHGFLEQHHHIQQLFEAATTSSEIALCPDCIDRISAALETDTQRLYSEAHSYLDAAKDAQNRNKTLEATLSNAGNANDWQDTERAYQNEIEMLHQEVQAREAELLHLNSLYSEQLEITKQLEAYQEEVEQEQNALELHATTFDDSTKLLSRTLSTVQTEVDQLCMVKLPQSLFDLQVDERGLRYPLINQLRLAYRPKGDVPLREIQVAWSQATQLLLVLGSLLRYPSSDWKLVPLADCAKLIYRKEIYNLSPGDCRSLMAWNALLDQVVQHARHCTHVISSNPASQSPTATKQSTPSTKNQQDPPVSSSSNSIGDIDLTRLDPMDHVGWSRVIHRMASNLLWLSERSADFCSLQVSALAHSTV